jgi:hypothetical protein
MSSPSNSPIQTAIRTFGQRPPIRYPTDIGNLLRMKGLLPIPSDSNTDSDSDGESICYSLSSLVHNSNFSSVAPISDSDIINLTIPEIPPAPILPRITNKSESFVSTIGERLACGAIAPRSCKRKAVRY